MTGTYEIQNNSSFDNWKNGCDLWQSLIERTFVPDSSLAAVTGCTNVRGIAYHGGYYYVADQDGSDYYIRKYATLTGTAETDSVDVTANVNVAYDITTDGTYIYIANGGSGVVRYTTALVYVDTLSSMLSIKSIAYYGGYLYGAEGISNNTIYKYTTAGVLVTSGTYEATNDTSWMCNIGDKLYLRQYDVILELDTDLNTTGQALNGTVGQAMAYDGTDLYFVPVTGDDVDTMTITVNTTFPYLCVPFDSNGDSIKTDGDAVDGYVWVSKNEAGVFDNNQFTTFNFPFNEDTEAADLPMKNAGVPYWFDYDTIQGYKTNGTNNYVDTGITTDNSLDWELTGRFIDPDQTKTQVVFGSREDVSTDKAFLGYSANAYIFNWGSVGGAFQVAGNNRVDDRSHTFKKDGDDFLANGTVIYSGLDTSGLTSDNNLFLAALSDNDTAGLHSEYVLERLRIWNSSGTLLYDIAPDGSGNYYDDVASGNVTIEGDALTVIDETSTAGTPKDIKLSDANFDVYDPSGTQYHTIFSDKSVDYQWRNIIGYAAPITDPAERLLIYEYINAPYKYSFFSLVDSNDNNLTGGSDSLIVEMNVGYDEDLEPLYDEYGEIIIVKG